MKTVVWTDRRGWKHRSLIRDDDPDSMAEHGVSQDPPDMRGLDLEGISREINNAFIENKVFNWKDWQRNQHVSSIINSIVKRHVVRLLRQSEGNNGAQ